MAQLIPLQQAILEVVSRYPDQFTRSSLALRTGKATNPGYWVIKALSDFFGVDPNYFFQEGMQPVAQIDNKQANANLAARFQKSSVKDIALRASELDEAERQTILGMIEFILHKKDE